MIKLAIDLGSSMTKIYRADTNSGVVLAEPSCIAVNAEQEIKAIGKAAKKLIGKTAEYTTIVKPIRDGVIVDRALAARMLQEFLSRIGIAKSALKRALIVISIPCGLDDAALDEYTALVEECDLRNVRFVEQPYLAALGGGASLSETEPIFCLDIGGSVTNAAVISANGIISGLSINLGGTRIEQNIMRTLREEYHLSIGELTAERVKNKLGSCAEGSGGTMVVEGLSTETYKPDSKQVQSMNLKNAVRTSVDKTISYVTGVLCNLPEEVAATVHHHGVYLSGGIMKMTYAPQYIAGLLDMRYHIAEEPQFVTVLGGGVLLRDKELLNRFSKKLR